MVCQKSYRQKLGRAGIHKQRHTEGPTQTVTGLTQQDAEADAQKQVAGKDRQGIPKGGSRTG